MFWTDFNLILQRLEEIVELFTRNGYWIVIEITWNLNVQFVNFMIS